MKKIGIIKLFEGFLLVYITYSFVGYVRKKYGFYDRKGLVGCSQMGTTILNWRNSEICKCICIGYGVFVEKWPWFGLFVDGFNIFPIFWLTEI